ATILLDDGKTLVSAWEDIVRVEEDDEGTMRPMPAARAERPPRERGERRQRPANRRRERGERGERSDRPPRPSTKGEGRPRPQQRSPRPNRVSDE
ncbi:MAG: stage 0 sporulation protein, partial [Selenomonas sp.]|nr:stage 0 sporulation protein [Selenomonas sp.]